VIHTFAKSSMRSAAFSNDGSTLALLLGNSINLYSTKSWDLLGEPIAHPAWTYPQVICPLGESGFSIAGHTGKAFSIGSSKLVPKLISHTGNLYSSCQAAGPDSLWLESATGVLRQVDSRNGRVLSVIATTRGDQFARFGPGGELQTGLDSLLGLACVVDTEQGRKFIPAKDFYEKHMTLAP